MKFRAAFCDPFKKDIIELGDIADDNIIGEYKKVRWSEILRSMEKKNHPSIYYSPSLEIQNKESKQGLEISAVGSPDNIEFYVFYKRPKLVKIFFGLKEKMKENYTTDITGQTEKDVLDYLNALLNNDVDFLDNKIK